MIEENIMLKLWDREPVLILAAVEAIVALLVAFGVDISTELKTAIIGVVSTGLALWGRQVVTPVADPKFPGGAT